MSLWAKYFQQHDEAEVQRDCRMLGHVNVFRIYGVSNFGGAYVQDRTGLN